MPIHAGLQRPDTPLQTPRIGGFRSVVGLRLGDPGAFATASRGTLAHRPFHDVYHFALDTARLDAVALVVTLLPRPAAPGLV